jgi:hypothetical protein
MWASAPCVVIADDVAGRVRGVHCVVRAERFSPASTQEHGLHHDVQLWPGAIEPRRQRLFTGVQLEAVAHLERHRRRARTLQGMSPEIRRAGAHCTAQGALPPHRPRARGSALNTNTARRRAYRNPLECHPRCLVGKKVPRKVLQGVVATQRNVLIHVWGEGPPDPQPLQDTPKTPSPGMKAREGACSKVPTRIVPEVGTHVCRALKFLKKCSLAIAWRDRFWRSTTSRLSMCSTCTRGLHGKNLQ